MEWAAVDTLVKLTKGNVDAAQTSGNTENKLENYSRRHSSCNAISNVDTLHWLKTAETAAVDVPVINIILNTNTDRVESA